MTTGLLKVGEVARSLGVSLQTVWKLVRRGLLPVVAIGRARRFRPEDVELLIQASTLRPALTSEEQALPRPAGNAQKRPVQALEGFAPTCEPSNAPARL